MASKQEARRRARAAKARVDAKRAERDTKIQELQTNYFVGVAERDEARSAADAAEVTMGEAIMSLTALDLRLDEIASLCETTPSELRALKKTADQATPTNGDDDGDQGGQAVRAEQEDRRGDE